MRFVRYGGLSAVKYGKKVKDGFNASFHHPPVKRGIYAFIDPYVEDFLWAWKLPKGAFDETEEGEQKAREYRRKITRQLRRVFEYDGLIWCHFYHLISGEKRGSWVLTDTAGLQAALRKVAHEDAKSLQKDYNGKLPPVNPYIRGLGGFMSRDHLEVFIDAKHLGQIK